MSDALEAPRVADAGFPNRTPPDGRKPSMDTVPPSVTSVKAERLTAGRS